MTWKGLGVAEVLDVVGAYINGLRTPLKVEYAAFLERVLVPLHRPKGAEAYHKELVCCCLRLIHKDSDLAVPLLVGICKYWPWQDTHKQLAFLNELELILLEVDNSTLKLVRVPLGRVLSGCIRSLSFLVSERALYFWNDERLVEDGLFSSDCASWLLPQVFTALSENVSNHWDAVVGIMSENVLNLYQDYDIVLFDRCLANHKALKLFLREREGVVEESWDSIDISVAHSHAYML